MDLRCLIKTEYNFEKEDNNFRNNSNNSELSLNEQIFNYLQNIGFSSNTDEFDYLKDIILMLLDDEWFFYRKLDKNILGQISKKYNKSLGYIRSLITKSINILYKKLKNTNTFWLLFNEEPNLTLFLVMCVKHFKEKISYIYINQKSIEWHRITEFLDKIGLQPNKLGYMYIRETILILLENDFDDFKSKNQVYNIMLKKLNLESIPTTNIDRVIKFSINDSWKYKSNEEIFWKEFNSCPNVTVFLSMVIKYLRKDNYIETNPLKSKVIKFLDDIGIMSLYKGSYYIKEVLYRLLCDEDKYNYRISDIYKIILKDEANIGVISSSISSCINACWGNAKKNNFFWKDFDEIDTPTNKRFLMKSFNYLRENP